MLSFLLLLLAAGVIYVSCEFFVNGIEWLGRKLGITETATGTLLAAFGTALPESAVTFFAAAFGNTDAQKQIGVGAAMGGPLVLATIAYGIAGLMLLLCKTQLHRKNTIIHIDQQRLSRDQAWFLSIFLFKAALGLVLFSGKAWCGVFFLVAYGLYVRKEMHYQESQYEEDLEPLKFSPHTKNPKLALVLLQTVIALIVIGTASHAFVTLLEKIGPLLGLPNQLVALFLSPLATELPETMNAIIWIRQGKERLALANISGAMMIQATIPSAVGLFFTPWLFDSTLVVASLITILAVFILYLLFRRGHVSGGTLAPIGLLYGIFVVIAMYLA